MPRLTERDRFVMIAELRDWEMRGVRNRTALLALDLLDANAALTARAEQAERDRDTLAAEVSITRTLLSDKETIISAKAWLVQRVSERKKATDASGALDRAAKGGA